MKNLRIFFSILISSALMAPGASWATVKSDVTLGVDVFMGDQDNAKFREYRYNTKTPVNANVKVDIDDETGSRFCKVGLDARDKEDVDLNLETGSYGKYSAGLRVRRFGHNFAFGAKSIYDGAGTNKLTLPNLYQSYLQGFSTGTAQANALNSVYAELANPLDIGLRRDQVGLDFKWSVTEPITVKLESNYEKRKGTRPFGAGFGFGNAIEIPEPIDYDTRELNTGVEYAGKGFYASLDYEISAFSNMNNIVVYDNPFRITDSNNASAYSYNSRAGGSLGGHALPPDNTANHVKASVAKDLPFHSRVSASASQGWLRQNDLLNQPSLNTSLAALNTNQRTYADAAVDLSNYNVRWTSRPIKKLHVKADYEYSGHDNKTSSMTIIPIQFDGKTPNVTTDKLNPIYVSVIKRIAGMEAGYEIFDKTTLGAGLENEHANYVNGSAEKENENIYKLFLETERIKSLGLRLGYEHAAKRSVYQDYKVMEIPWMRKYYAASRDRDRVTTMADYEVTETLSTSLELIYGVDDYPASEFGLQKDVNHTATLSADYAVTDRVSVSPSYTLETCESLQRQRAWTAGGVGDPYRAAGGAINNDSNWTLETTDIVHTPGLTVKAVIVPEKLTFNASGFVSISNGTLNFASPIGPAANDANAFAPQDMVQADDSTKISVSTSFDYAVKKDMSFTLGYGYERWKIEDALKFDGYAPVDVDFRGAYAGNLTMDTLYKSYNVHMVSAKANYRF